MPVHSAPLEVHRLASLSSPLASTVSTPPTTSTSSPDCATDTLLGDAQRHSNDDDDGWEAERPPLKRDYLDDDGLGARLAARVPWLRSVARWRPDARRAQSAVVLAVGLATLIGIVVTTAAAGHLRHLADGLDDAASWRDKLSSAAHGVTGWLWEAEESWRRPMRIERDPTVSLADYLAALEFVPFPLPAATSSAPLDSRSTTATPRNTTLPHPSYSTTDQRNVVLLTMCDGRYVHAVRVWALRARDLGMHRDNVVILCLDAACLDEAEAHGLHAFGGFANFSSEVPVVGQGLETPDLPPLESSSSPVGKATRELPPLEVRAPLADSASAARAVDKREGPQGGAERGPRLQYIKFRTLYEVNAAGYASLYFEADTALTENAFNWMRPLVPDLELAALAAPPAELSIDERRRLPSPFALPRSAAERAAARPDAVDSDVSLVDPEGLDPGWDMVMTQDMSDVANFGFFLMRPTRATTLFWRSTLRQYVARGGWDQGVVSQSIAEHGWSQQWLRGWWEEGALGGEGDSGETLREAPTTLEEKNKHEQWHFVDKLDGLRQGERLRIAMLPIDKFFAYHTVGFSWWTPPRNMPDPIVHHLTAIQWSMRNFWPKERGWYSNVDGYYTRPRPLLVPWNVTHKDDLDVAGSVPRANRSSPRTFYSRDPPDFAASTLTGSPHDLLHYARILQLLGGVSTRVPSSAASSNASFAVETAGSISSTDTFAVKLPGKLHISRDEDIIEQDSTRLVDLDAAVRASVDVVEPAFFQHAAAFLSPAELTAWTSTRLRISLAAFDAPSALVSHLRDALAPYLGSTAAGFPARGVVVELEGWEATLGWSLDDLDAEERASGIDVQGFEALKRSRRCQGWDQLEKLPFMWCTAEE